MATYCYTSKKGETIEVQAPMGQARKKVRRRGVTFHKDPVADMRGSSASRRGTGSWPILSNGLGVNPCQIPEALKHAKKHGCDVSFTPDGRAVLKDNETRNKYLLARGLFDMDACYRQAGPAH